MTRTGGQAGCVFCEALAGDEASLVVFRGVSCYVILNKFPYNNGHLMVVPKRHVATFATANDAELTELMQLTRFAEMALTTQARAGRADLHEQAETNRAAPW